jgi:hypothetical protein
MLTTMSQREKRGMKMTYDYGSQGYSSFVAGWSA